MEILRLACPTETHEQAGTTALPELLTSSTNRQGRIIPTGLESIPLGYKFQSELERLKNAGKKDKQDKVGVYYVNGHGLEIDEDREYFSGNNNEPTIRVEIDPPQVNPGNPKYYLPKTKSVGALVHYSQSRLLPMPDNLLHLLLEDRHFKAATAAFFLTRNDDLYGLFRTEQSPQADIERARRITKNMKAVSRDYYYKHSNDKSVDGEMANMLVLKEAIWSYGLTFYHGRIKDGKLQQSNPEYQLI